MNEYEMAVSVAKYHNLEYILWVGGGGITIKCKSDELSSHLKECGLKFSNNPAFSKWYTEIEFKRPVKE